MTTRQSTTLHISDETDERNGLAFSTIEIESGGHEPVLEIWGTIFAPDGQPLNAKMLVPMRDVRDLQSFLNDEYGRTRDENARRTTDAGSLEYYPDSTDLPKVNPGDLALVQYGDQTFSGIVGEVQPNGTQSINFTGTSTEKPRQCPYISNGVQCTRPENHGTTDGLNHYLPGEGVQEQGQPMHQPDVDLFQEQASAIQQSANLQVVNEPGDEMPPTGLPQPAEAGDLRNEAEKARKRRLKIEMEFDKALEAHKNLPSDRTWAALVDAYEAVEKKEPDNSRVRRGIMHLQNSALAPAVQEATEDFQRAGQVLIDAANEAGHSVPSFAPEQSQQAYQPVPNNGYDPSLHAAEEQFEASADRTFETPATNYLKQVAPPTYQQTSPSTGLPQPVVALDPASQQAAAAFPCVARHSQTDQQCVRPAGHDIETPQHPATPHMFATDPSTLGQPVPQPASPPTYVAPQQAELFVPQGFPATPPAQAGGQPMPVAHLQAVPNQPMGLYDGEPGMPTAPAMPTWQAPQQ